jgi:hypothetical protein
MEPLVFLQLLALIPDNLNLPHKENVLTVILLALPVTDLSLPTVLLAKTLLLILKHLTLVLKTALKDTIKMEMTVNYAQLLKDAKLVTLLPTLEQDKTVLLV